MKKNSLKSLLEELVLEVLSEIESGSYVEPMDSISEEELDELNANATTGDMAYNTPGAFRKTDGTEEDDESGFTAGHKDPEVLGYKKAKVSKRNFESLRGVIRDIIKEELKEAKKIPGKCPSKNKPWTNAKDVKQERSFFSDMYKDEMGFRPRNLSDEELADWANNNFCAKNSEIFKNESITEATYRSYKYDQSASPQQKVNSSIHNINSQLIKIERIISQNIKLKQESGIDNAAYWKSTRNKFQKVNERLMRISGKLRELWR